jgi:uncharacterized membrane protein YphA (DoxX/SURF4 family)
MLNTGSRGVLLGGAVLVGRLIFAAVFAMAFVFKAIGLHATADFIAAAGFPIPLVLAFLAAVLELALVLCFLTGAFFSEAALVAAVYVLFLGFSFHGPPTGPATRTNSASSSTTSASWPACCSPPRTAPATGWPCADSVSWEPARTEASAHRQDEKGPGVSPGAFCIRAAWKP